MPAPPPSFPPLPHEYPELSLGKCEVCEWIGYVAEMGYRREHLLFCEECAHTLVGRHVRFEHANQP